MNYKTIILNNNIVGTKLVFSESWDTQGKWKFTLGQWKSDLEINWKVNYLKKDINVFS